MGYDQGKFNQTALPKKRDFYSHFNVEDISNICKENICNEFVKILK